VLPGELADLDVLRAGASASDGVLHLGYVHDFSRMEDAADTDRAAIDVFGSALAGTGGPLLIASGVAGLQLGRPATELDTPAPETHPRVANAAAALALAEHGMRPIVVRFAPTVHGPGDHGFVARLVAAAREKGVSAYIGDGAHHWAAVHRLDAARLVRLAVDEAPAGGAVLHAVAEPGVRTRDIAEAIGRGLDLPVVSVPAEQAVDHFGWIGMFFGMDCLASNDLTRERYHWTPTHASLIEDLDAGAYF
jgi:nucleoside-diphosphate-sugar epimerase